MMEEVVEHLRQIDLFGELRLRHLRLLANLFERVDYDRGDYVTRQGEVGDRFFLLLAGRAVVWHVDSQGVERQVGVLHSGDYFGVTSLFVDEARDATVRVEENSTVFSLTRPQFSEFLEEFPAAREAIAVPEALKERLEARRFKWMTPDEVAVFYANKTRWTLLAAELLPSLIFLVLATVATLIREMAYLPTILTLLAVLIGGGWALLRWQDWRNDYYVVTNKRVVHHESRLPSLQVTIDQAPLYQIQNVNMLMPGPLANWLNFGTLDIQTAGRSGAVTFRYLDDPERCQQLIFDLLEKERSLLKIGEREAIRDAITQHIQPQQETPSEADEPGAEEASPALYSSGEALWDLGEPPAEPPPKVETGTTAGERLRSLLPYFRQERGGVITWHKHPFVLLKALWIPSLVLLVPALIGVIWAIAGWSYFESVLLVLFVVWCIGLFWSLWRYEDWRNEIFQMTPSHIMDIDRLPLGFRESRRQAALEQIQNINVDIPNVWARLFNYGNVVIETAGPAGDLTFEWVMRPRSVQAEIFGRIEALQNEKRAEELEQRRAEMAEWFAIYHQMRGRGEI
jgi:membrane protein YdbS with pleckstrin-like domain